MRIVVLLVYSYFESLIYFLSFEMRFERAKFKHKKFLISVHYFFISRLTLCGYLYVWLIDNISSKIVVLETGLTIYRAIALSLLPVVLFLSFINVYVWFFSFCTYWLSFLYVYDMVQYNRPDWLTDWLGWTNEIMALQSSLFSATSVMFWTFVGPISAGRI